MRSIGGKILLGSLLALIIPLLKLGNWFVGTPKTNPKDNPYILNEVPELDPEQLLLSHDRIWNPISLQLA